MDQHDFIYPLHHPVRHRLADLHSGDLQNGGAEALDVLDIHGGEDIDVVLQQLHLQPDAQQRLSRFVVQLTADAAALHFLDVEHMLGQPANLLLPLSQILHQASFFRGH